MWRYGLMVLGMLSAFSAVESQVQAARGGIPVAPKRWAQVQLQNGRITLLHDWVELGDFAPAAVCSGIDQTLVFDHFGADPQTGNPVGGDTRCGLQYEDDRYFMGWDYHNPYYANDIAGFVSSNYAGKDVTTLAHAWVWTPPDAERCYVIILTADSFSCSDPTHDAFAPNNRVIDGIALDYGILSPNYSWYYYSVVCLRDLGARLRLPSNRPGAYLVVYARDVQGYGSSTEVTLASGAQPALWSTEITGIGSSGEKQFDDVLPPFGNHSTSECLDYTDTGCVPSRTIKFGGMMAFWAETLPSCVPCPDTNGDGTIDDADLLNVLFAFGNSGDPGFDPADTNCDGDVDDADLLDVLFAFGGGGC